LIKVKFFLKRRRRKPGLRVARPHPAEPGPGTPAFAKASIDVKLRRDRTARQAEGKPNSPARGQCS
jgi:hypothetical protein